MSGLQKKYGEDLTFALQVKQLCALALIVPVLDVIKSFNTILESQYFIDYEQVNKLFEPLVDYFEETKKDRTVRNRRNNHYFQ